MMNNKDTASGWLGFILIGAAIFYSFTPIKAWGTDQRIFAQSQQKNQENAISAQVQTVETPSFHNTYTDMDMTETHHFNQRNKMLGLTALSTQDDVVKETNYADAIKSWITERVDQFVSIPFQEENSLSVEAQAFEMQYFHKPYTDMGTVKIHHFKQRNEVLEFIVSTLVDEGSIEEIQSIDLKDRWFQPDYYYITREQTDYYYIGKLKNNRPHGLGIIIMPDELFNGFQFVYAGNFKNGMKQGYGVEFNTDGLSAGILAYVEEGQYDEDTLDALLIYSYNPVTYEGFWKKNKWDGKGNCFIFNILQREPLEGYIFRNIYPDVVMGEYQKDNETGTENVYINNQLYFSGKMKKGSENGNGTLYYPNGQIQYKGNWKNGKYYGKGTLYYPNGQIQYKGNWKNGEYHGKGSLYEEDGSLTYSGTWKNGDYAH